jgi:PAS domain S-box-containing protein
MHSPGGVAAEPSHPGSRAAPRPHQLSLRWRLTLLVVASVIPLLVFILVFQYVQYLKDVDTTGQRTLALARSISLLVDQELQTRVSALEALAVSRSLADGDFAGFRTKAAAVVARQFPGANILVLREDGQQLVDTLVPPGVPLSVRPDMESTTRVFQTDRPAVSNLYQVATRPVVAIDVPVESGDGKIAYVLSLSPRLKAFTDVIGRQQLPATWLTAVLDRRGVVVARVPNGDRYVGREASSSALAHLLREREGIIKTVSLEGIPLLTAFSHADRFGWAVAIGVPRAELTAPAFWGTMRTLGAGGLLLGLGLALALYASCGIAGPIESLRRQAAAADRDVPFDLAPSGLREVDEVARALNAAEEGRRRSRQAEAILRDGIETIPEGFVIYDDDGRLVMCNDSYRRLYDGMSDYIVPGASFADLWRARLTRGNYPIAKGREEAWIADRVRDLRELGDGVEQLLEGGQWILVRNRQLSNGWIAGLRIDITARKATEQALRRSEERFRLVVESVPNAILGFNAGGIIELVNVQAEQIFGYPRAELLGQGIEMLLAERLRADHLELRNAFFAARQSRPVGSGRELHGRRRDGQEFPIEVGLSPMETADGTKALVSIVDITDRRQAERTQSYYAAIVESSADAIIAKNLDGMVTSWNESAQRMFGWSADEMLGQPIIRLLSADRLDEEAVILTQIRRGDRIDHFETVRCRKDGAEFPVSLTISPILGAGGEIVGASKIVRDITERTRMAGVLRISEDRFRTIFSAVSEGIFILSPANGSFTEINEPGCVMFGYTADELIGGNLQMLSSGVPPYTQSEADERIEQAATSGRPERFYWHCKAKDGPLFWAEISIRSALISGQESVLAIVGDVDERLAVEAQLRQAQKMEAVGNLSGGMAHDFNNMLGVIIGSLDLVVPLVKDNDAAAELVQEAIGAAVRSAELTARLLAFARRQPLRPEAVAPNNLISGIVQLLRRTLGENIEIVLDLADDLWPIVVDSAQLEASLTNLATNARDAMSNGGRLSIATVNRVLDSAYADAHFEVTAGDYAVIEVSDTGIGMAPEIAQHIFEPFYTTKGPGVGTGLGLSMVFGFIKQSGGHISVYTEPGVGTTFRLFLPRAPARGDAKLAIKSQSTSPRLGAGERVLVVEDDPRLRRVVMRQLSELGYQPIEADGAAAALAILEHEKIVLVFTDVVMPGPLDGIALARQVIERWPTVRVVLTSGFAGSKFDDRLVSQRAPVPLLSKPYRVEDLAKVLRQALDG